MAWNRNDQPSVAVEKKPKGGLSKWASHVAAAIVVVGGVVVWFALRPAAPEKPATTPTKKAAIVEPPAQTNARPRRTIGEIIRSRGGRKNLTEEDKAELAILRKEMVAKAGMPPSPMPGRGPRVKRVFECHSDQIIALVMTSGDNIPPFPGTNEQLEREFVRSLKVPIVINDDDSEELKRTKQAVIDARAAIDEEMKKGRGFREILDDYRKQVNDNTKMRREAKAKAGEIMRTEGVEAAEQYVEKANEKLQEWGISSIDRPRTKEEIVADLQQRKLKRQEMQNNKNKEVPAHE